MYLHQEIPGKKISFWIIIVVVFSAVLLKDVLAFFFQYLPAIAVVVANILLLLTFVYATYQFVYFQLARYNYQFVEDYFVFERVVGRTNHAVVTVKCSDLISCEAVDGIRVKRRDFFSHTRKGDNLFALRFKSEKGERVIVIEPNDAFIESIRLQLGCLRDGQRNID